MTSARYLDRLVAKDILALGNLQVDGDLQAGNLNDANIITTDITGNINSSNITISEYTGSLDGATISNVNTLNTSECDIEITTYSGTISNASGVYINHGMDDDYSLVVKGDANIDGELNVTGDIYTGNINLSTIIADVHNITGKLTIDGTTSTLNTDLDVSGNVSVDSLKFTSGTTNEVDVNNLTHGTTVTFNVEGTTDNVIKLSGPEDSTVMLSMDSILYSRDPSSSDYHREVITSVSCIKFGNITDPVDTTVDTARTETTIGATHNVTLGADNNNLSETEITLVYEDAGATISDYDVVSHVSITLMNPS